MATEKQVRVAKRNIRKAQGAAKSKRTIAHLPEATRRDLGKQVSKARTRGGRAGCPRRGRSCARVLAV